MVILSILGVIAYKDVAELRTLICCILESLRRLACNTEDSEARFECWLISRTAIVAYELCSLQLQTLGNAPTRRPLVHNCLQLHEQTAGSDRCGPVHGQSTGCLKESTVKLVRDCCVETLTFLSECLIPGS